MSLEVINHIAIDLVRVWVTAWRCGSSVRAFLSIWAPAISTSSTWLEGRQWSPWSTEALIESSSILRTEVSLSIKGELRANISWSMFYNGKVIDGWSTCSGCSGRHEVQGGRCGVSSEGIGLLGPSWVSSGCSSNVEGVRLSIGSISREFEGSKSWSAVRVGSQPEGQGVLVFWSSWDGLADRSNLVSIQIYTPASRVRHESSTTGASIVDIDISNASNGPSVKPISSTVFAPCSCTTRVVLKSSIYNGSCLDGSKDSKYNNQIFHYWLDKIVLIQNC